MALHSPYLHCKLNKYYCKLNKYKQYCIHLHEKCYNIVHYSYKYIAERENLLDQYILVTGLYL